MKPRCRSTRTPIGYLSCTRSEWCAANCRSSAPFPPRDRPALHRAVLDEILEEPVPPRAHRRNKRGVKRKMSSFPVRRKADRPPPPIDSAKAIRILEQDPLRSDTERQPRSKSRVATRKSRMNPTDQQPGATLAPTDSDPQTIRKANRGLANSSIQPK